MQAVLDGEDIQKLEAELLIDDDEGKFEAQFFAEALHALLALSFQCIGASYALLILLNNHFVYRIDITYLTLTECLHDIKFSYCLSFNISLNMFE